MFRQCGKCLRPSQDTGGGSFHFCEQIERWVFNGFVSDVAFSFDIVGQPLSDDVVANG
jgi:hypothetical protein